MRLPRWEGMDARRALLTIALFACAVGVGGYALIETPSRPASTSVAIVTPQTVASQTPTPTPLLTRTPTPAQTSVPSPTATPPPTPPPTPTPTQTPRPTPTPTPLNPEPPAIPGQLFGDGFQADRVGVAPDDGWVTQGTGWTVGQNGANRYLHLNGFGAASAGNPAWSDYAVSASVQGSGGIALRVSATGDLYGCVIGGGHLSFFKTAASKFYFFNSVPLATPGTWFGMTATAKGAALTCSAQGVTIKATDASLPAGRAGVTGEGNLVFDDVRIVAM